MRQDLAPEPAEAFPPGGREVVVVAQLQEQAPVGGSRPQLLTSRVEVAFALAQVDAGGDELAVELDLAAQLLGVAEQAVQRLPGGRQLLQLDPVRPRQAGAQLVPGGQLRLVQVERLHLRRPAARQHQLERQLERVLGEPGPALRMRAEGRGVGVDVDDAAAASIRRLEARRLLLHAVEEVQ